MIERQVDLPSVGLAARFVDAVVRVFSPEKAARRAAMRAIERSSNWRAATRSRVDTGSGLFGHPDAINELSYDRSNVVANARKLEQDNMLAAALLDRYTDNVVSPHVRFQAKTKNVAWNRAAEALMTVYEAEADVRGMDSLTDLFRALERSKERDGDAGLVLIKDGKHKGCIQLIESDQIMSPAGEPVVGSRIVDGVELDGWGRPVRFHVLGANAELDRTMLSRRGQLPKDHIPADYFVFHSRRSRIGQTRGLSVFSQSMWVLEQLDKVVEAVVLNARIAACFGLVIRQPGGFPGLSTVPNGSGNPQRSMTLEPGMIKTIEADEQVETVSPSQPHENLGSFIRLLVLFAGSAFAFPLELALLDFSSTNLSAARLALQQAQLSFKVKRVALHRAIRRVYDWKLQEWMRTGRLPVNEEWQHYEVMHDGWAYMDPLKDIEAKLLAISGGLTTRARSLADVGIDHGDFIDEVKRERDAEKAAGVEFESGSAKAEQEPKQKGEPVDSPDKNEKD